MVRQSIARGCQAFVIREGWEGLVRGNVSDATPVAPSPAAKSTAQSPVLPPTAAKSVSFSSLPPSQQLKLSEVDTALAPGDMGEAHAVNYTDADWVAPLSDAPLSFGYGELLKDGAGEGDDDAQAAGDGTVMTDSQGRTLKGKYIVRLGWDDTRGWLGEGGTLIGSSRCPSCETHTLITDSRELTH